MSFRQELRGSSRGSIDETALLLGCEWKVGIPLELKQGNQPSSQDEVGNTGLSSSCCVILVLPLEW